MTWRGHHTRTLGETAAPSARLHARFHAVGHGHRGRLRADDDEAAQADPATRRIIRCHKEGQVGAGALGRWRPGDGRPGQGRGGRRRGRDVVAGVSPERPRSSEGKGMRGATAPPGSCTSVDCKAQRIGTSVRGTARQSCTSVDCKAQRIGASGPDPGVLPLSLSLSLSLSTLYIRTHGYGYVDVYRYAFRCICVYV